MPNQIAAPFTLTVRLWWRYWPQLVALVLAGVLANELLLRLAVRTGFANHMAGLAVLTLVALAHLVITVMMFQLLLPALPALAAAQRQSRGDADSALPNETASSRLVRAVTVALLPFFAYYAAWGFLGDTVRQYSRAAIDLDPFGSHGNVLDVLDSRWLLSSVAVSWLIRMAAKRMRARTQRPVWQVVVVICETNWILVGLYVIGRWKDDAWAWIASRNAWHALGGFWDALATPISAAWSAPMVPVEAGSVSAGATLLNLFFYALLPLVWLVMAALIYGYDARDPTDIVHVHRRIERFGDRYKAIPQFLRDFVEHFIGGYRTRYLPIANGIRLTLHSGVLLLVTLMVGYRLIDWGSAWLWLGAAHVVGPHDLYAWQPLAHVVTLLFGSPFRDSSTGILIEPLRICFLAAVLETAFALPGRSAQTSSVPVPARP